MKLVEDWKNALTWFSVQINTLGASLLASYMLLPEDWKSAIPKEWLAIAAVCFMVLSSIGRVISQKKE